MWCPSLCSADEVFGPSQRALTRVGALSGSLVLGPPPKAVERLAPGPSSVLAPDFRVGGDPSLRIVVWRIPLWPRVEARGRCSGVGSVRAKEKEALGEKKEVQKKEEPAAQIREEVRPVAEEAPTENGFRLFLTISKRRIILTKLNLLSQKRCSKKRPSEMQA